MSVHVTIKALLQGIATDDLQRTRDAWRALVRKGNPAAAALAFILEQGNWSVRGSEAHVRHLAFLLAALHRIDPRMAQGQCARLFNLEIDPAHEATLRRMSVRLAGPASHVTAHGIEIATDPDLSDPDAAVETVTGWLEIVSTEHLESIDRITVAPKRAEFAYLDRFAMVFPDISVSLPPAGVTGLARVAARRTLYFAIAHHSLAQRRYHSDARLEAEARRLANRLMRRAHPALAVVSAPIAALSAPARAAPDATITF